uniref:Uncharacterized protein n=1 Tax=Lepeophtheirus salmonis TaxID=72036 RepID=A0A0K2UQF0_LEPSM
MNTFKYVAEYKTQPTMCPTQPLWWPLVSLHLGIEFCLCPSP